MTDYTSMPFDINKLTYFIKEKTDNAHIYNFRYEGIDKLGEFISTMNSELMANLDEEQLKAYHEILDMFAVKAMKYRIQHHLFEEQNKEKDNEL